MTTSKPSARSDENLIGCIGLLIGAIVGFAGGVAFGGWVF